MKFTIDYKGSISTNYGTKELRLNKYSSKTISISRGAVEIMKGTNILSIDDNAIVSKCELEKFVEENFVDKEKAFKRINNLINPQTFKTIF